MSNPFSIQIEDGRDTDWTLEPGDVVAERPPSVAVVPEECSPEELPGLSAKTRVGVFALLTAASAFLGGGSFSVWREVDVPARPNLELLVLDAPWGSALDDPETLMELVQRDVDCGFAEWTPGGRDEVRQRLGRQCAAGLGDVEEFISRHPDVQWIAFVLDVKTAHKRVKVAPDEQGYSVFTAVDPQGNTRWLVYRTCHFGGAWSAYWWSRVAAGYVRRGHLLLHRAHFLAMYVDDELSLFPAATGPLMAGLLVALACVLGIPLSWKKMALGPCVKWAGWLLNLQGAPRASLPEDKTVRIVNGLLVVIRRGDVCRRDLQSLVAECGSSAVRRPQDLQSCRLKHGRAWVKFLDDESATVRPSRQEAEVAEFFLRAVRLRVAGIGGWFLPEGAPLAVSSIVWFSIPLDAHSLPGWFADDDTDLETTICALEALAQLVLLVMQVSETACSSRRPNVGCIALRQQSDNLGVVCSSAKGLSMKEPLASILQATAVFCMQEHLNLRISHLAGCRNCWADALSRGAAHDATFWSQLSPARRKHLDWRSIMQDALYPKVQLELELRFGNTLALNGRDCSTQRPFQKIFEEGPPTIAKPDVFHAMERAAMRLTALVSYRGAGTVEYLYIPETGAFYFLELNPDLQAEHPVTEAITGVNMPATQLQIAMGIPLYNVPDIRRFYGMDPAVCSKIDFFAKDYPPITSHCCACRITAENPDEGFKPTSPDT
ncbi:HFA1 [Symbiodinium sp. CCMP2592]|nr:HFA1 [Symbiodinium sp. CCMP2592]